MFQGNRWFYAWTGFLLAAILSAVLLTFRDYGITWDESFELFNGELALDYFTSGFKDLRYNDFALNRTYGPFFEVISAAIYKSFNLPKYETHHFLIGLTALFGVLGLIFYSRLFKDKLAVIFAPLALIMMPRFYGDAFNNHKDMPFACFFIWSMFAIARLFVARSYSWKHFIFCGLAIGLALAVRTGGFLLFFYMACAALFSLPHLKVFFKERDNAFLLGLKILLCVALAWVLMILLWPWAHENIFLNPIRVFFGFLNFPFASPILFEGRLVLSNELPWYYFWKFFLITTPPILIIFAGFGVACSVKKLISHFNEDESLARFMILLWFFFPMVYFMLKRPNVYNGIRHFLFVVPALALFAGLGASFVLEKIRPIKLKILSAVVLLALFLVPVKDLMKLHPYQTTYFNFLVGGVGKAYLNYEHDYWGSSYKEAAEWLLELKKRLYPEGKTMVLVAGDKSLMTAAQYYLARDPTIEVWGTRNKDQKGPLPQRYNFYLAMNSQGYSMNYPEAPIIHTVGREGAIFSVIKARIAP